MMRRVLVGVVLALLFFSVLLLGGWYQCVVFSLAALLCAYELKHALGQSGHKLFIHPAYVFAAAFFPVYRLLGADSVVLLWLACVLAICAERVLNRNRDTGDALITLAVMVYPLVFFVLLMRIAQSGDFAFSRVGLFAAFAMPLIGDTLAYFLGVTLGSRKLCPELSPNKTVAGGVGGLLGGMLGGLLAYLLQGIYDAGMPLWVLLALGLACGALGQFGDLFASAIKRYTGVKDYGSIFPGHGGMMDRLDSTLFCAPLIYAVFTLWPH